MIEIKKGIAYNFIDEEVVIINPQDDKIICLTKEGSIIWKNLIDGKEVPEDFVNFLSNYRLIETTLTTQKEISEKAKYLKWEEKFSPVTFGRSCGLLPAQGGPCLGYPFQ